MEPSSEAPAAAATDSKAPGKPWERFAAASAGGTPPPLPEPTAEPAAGKPWERFRPKRIVEKQETLAKGVEQAFGRAAGHDPGIDYKSGLDWLDRAVLDTTDNPAERQVYLANKYGADKIGQDSRGHFYVLKDGKKVSAEGGGFFSGMAAEGVANAPQLVLGGAGAALGGGLAGPGGAMAGAGLGSMAGKSLVEFGKGLRGGVRKTPGETATALRNEGITGMLGEGAARGIGAVLSAPMSTGDLLRGGVRPMISDTTPESRFLTRTTIEGGARPPTVSALPGMKATQFHQALFDKVFGTAGRDTANLGFIRSELERTLAAGGVPAPEIKAVLDEIMDSTTTLSTKSVGEALVPKAKAAVDAAATDVERAQAGVETAQAAQKTARESADKAVHDASLKRFDAEIAARVANVDRAVGAGKQPGTITTDVATAIANERKQLAAEAKPIYDAIWQMAPRPILNTSTPKAAAQAIVEGIPPGTRTVFHQIADLPDVITLQQAHEVRTLLREASKPMNLAASGIDKSKIRALKVQIDGMFDQVGSRSDSAPAAVMMMRDVDAKYLQGIRKFEDSVLNKLVKDIKSGFPPDPEVTAATVLRAGNESRAAEIKKIVGPDAWQRIAAIDYRVMMANATTKDGRLDSAALLQEIDKRGRTFEVTHGAKETAELRAIAARLAERPTAAPIVALNANHLLPAMRALEQATKARDKLLENDFVAAFAKPGYLKDGALDLVVKGGEEQRLERAFKFYGEGSPEVAEIRQAFLKSTLKRAIISTPTGVGRTVGGDAMEQALKPYTKKQLDMLLPGGLGDDLKLLAQQAKFLFPPKGENMAAGLAAGTIKAALPFGVIAGGLAGTGHHEAALAAVAGIGFWGYLLNNPSTIRYLALGLSDTRTKQAMRETMKGLIRAGARGALPDVGGLTSDIALPDPDQR